MGAAEGDHQGRKGRLFSSKPIVKFRQPGPIGNERCRQQILFTAIQPSQNAREAIRQLIRVSRTISDWGIGRWILRHPADGEKFYRETHLAMPPSVWRIHSPVWFNVGLTSNTAWTVPSAIGITTWNREVEQLKILTNFHRGPHALSKLLKTTWKHIMRLATSEAMLFKFGFGNGN